MIQWNCACSFICEAPLKLENKTVLPQPRSLLQQTAQSFDATCALNARNREIAE